MKKFLFSLSIIFSCSFIEVFSQTNILPQSGNVGIGTTTPTSPLHLMGNLTLQGLSTSNYIPTLFFKRYSDSAPIFSFGYKNPSAPNSFFDFNSLNGNPITFSMVNVERMSILENGNVGIGTTSPQTKLDVRGSIISANPDYSNGSTGSILQIQQGVTSGNTYSEIGAYINGGTAWGNLILNRGGNVGIGTTVPSQKLDVLGNANISGIITTSTINSNGAKSQMSGVDIGNPTGDNNIQIGSGNGAFGSRYAYLDIVGDDTYTDYGLRLIRGNTGLNANSQLVHRGTGDLQIYTNEAAPILLITGTTEKMRVLANGNVGIGTANPTEKLSIYGVNNSLPGIMSFESSREDIQNAEVGILKAKNSGVEIAKIGLNRAGGSYTGFLNFWVKKTNETAIYEAMRISENGDVGIGTANPTTKLQVNGGLRISDFFAMGNNQFQWFKDASGSERRLIGLSGANIAYFGDVDNTITGSMNLFQANSQHRFFTNGTEKLTVIQNGNIGIGTTNPTAKLEIASTTGSGLKLSGLSQTNVQQGVTRNLGINDAGEVIVTNNNSTNQIAPSNVSLTSLEKNVLFYAHKRFKYTQTGSAKLDDALLFDGSFEPSYTNTAPSETDPTVILIEDLPQYHVQRGVWIGWSTRYWPSTKFKIEVFDTWNYSGNANYNKWVTIANESNYAGYDYKVFLPTSSIYPVISKIRFTFYNGSGDNGRLGVSELFYLSPEISKAYDGFLAKLNPDGNLGIGTSSPTQKLEIRGNSGSPASSGINQNGIVSISSNDTYGTLHMGNNISSPYGFWLQSAGRNDLSINYPLLLNPNGGNIGIGTTTPTAKLHLQGTQFKQNDETGSYGFTLNTTSATSRLITMFGGSSFAIQTGGGAVDNFTVNSAGNVGIGTTTPTAPLEVNGNANFSSGNLVRAIAFFYNNKFNIQANSNSSGLDIGTTTASPISFYTNGVTSPKMTISGDGNVSIGTTTMPANYKLAIGGDMIAERVVVKLQSNWPDYVFKKNYGLRPLEQVEQFINKNSHLPEVPSAQEVSDKGIDVGAMNAKLLQKVEELTLYLIEQNKEIKSQSKELTSLKKELEVLRDKK